MAGNRWVPWDVGYFRNPKARALGKNGRALHLASTCWSAHPDNLTDGFVPRTTLSLLCGEAEVPRSTLAVMLSTGVWYESMDGRDGWVIHDFLTHNKSRSEVEAEREKWKTKKKGQREKSPGDTQGDTTGESPGESPPCPSSKTKTDLDLDLDLAGKGEKETDRHQQPQSSLSPFDAAVVAYVDSVAAEPQNYGNARVDKWRQGVARNCRDEHADTIEAMLEQGHSPQVVGAVLNGAAVPVREEPIKPLPTLTADEKATAAEAAAKVRADFNRRHLQVLQGEGESA